MARPVCVRTPAAPRRSGRALGTGGREADASMNRTTRALTLVEVLIAVALVVVVLVMLIPATSNKPTNAPKHSCVSNLRQIDAAEQAWAREQHKTTNDIPAWSDLQPYLKGKLICPSGGEYILSPAGQAPSCSLPDHQALFVKGRDAPEFP